MCNQCILPSVIYVNEPLDETFSGDTMFRAAMFSLRSFHVQGIANGGIPLCYTGTAIVYKYFTNIFVSQIASHIDTSLTLLKENEIRYCSSW